LSSYKTDLTCIALQLLLSAVATQAPIIILSSLTGSCRPEMLDVREQSPVADWNLRSSRVAMTIAKAWQARLVRSGIAKRRPKFFAVGADTATTTGRLSEQPGEQGLHAVLGLRR